MPSGRDNFRRNRVAPLGVPSLPFRAEERQIQPDYWDALVERQSAK